MSSEIRGLVPNIYINEDGDMLLDIFRRDDGIHIVHTDLEFNQYSEWVIEPHGNVNEHSIGYAVPDAEGE